MYVHNAFKIDRPRAIALLRQRAFGMLVVPAPNAPAAVHVPFLVNEGPNEKLSLELHIARANSLHTMIGDGGKVLLICQGADAYISPDWLGVPNQVPTWTYQAVHLTGTVRRQPDEETPAHLVRLSAYFEQRLLPKQPWTMDKLDDDRRTMLQKVIVPIVIEVETIEAQHKLIQHKGETEHTGAIAGLRGGLDAGSHVIADLMQETARQKFGGFG